MSDYYGAVAQIVPVLLLAVMLESRLLDAMPRASRAGWLSARRFFVFAMVIAVFTEFFALFALAQDDDDIPGGIVVTMIGIGALLGSLGGIFFSEVVMGVPPDEDDDDD